MKIVIPAREGSKGLPHKNRTLLEHTLAKIPKNLKDSVIITTDDKFIIEKTENEFNVLKRRKELSADDTSTKDVILNVIEECEIGGDEIIIMLYLTYPERQWKEIEKAISFFKNSKGATSLLCKKETKTHPWLCLIEEGENFGKQIVEHNLYRRQDYPKCFEISHYISIFYASGVQFLNKNLYNSKTVFYPIEEKVDVDTYKDLKRFHDQDNC